MLGTTIRIWNTTTAVATIASAYLRKHQAADAIAYTGRYSQSVSAFSAARNRTRRTR